MSDFYRDMQTVATGLLSQFAQGSLQFIAVAPGTGSPDAPGQIETVYPFDGTVTGVGAEYVNNSDIFATDVQAIAPGILPIADAKGFLVVDGKRLKVAKVVPRPAAGVPVVFIVIANR